MPDLLRLLNKNGSIDELAGESFAAMKRIAGETDPQTIAAGDLNAEHLVIEFNAAADGRGYSLAKSVLRDMGYRGQLYAYGYLNPDQLSFALQTGFDAVLVTVERWNAYGAEAWQSALQPVVNLSYVSTDSPALRSIWQMRHAQSAS